MKRSKISWTDYSGGDLNFVTGCTPISEGCANCYAKRIYQRFGRDFSQVQTHPDKLRRLVNWGPAFAGNRRGPQTKPMAFVCDTGDLFHEAVPDEFIQEALSVMVERTDIEWQILTKRAYRMAAGTIRFVKTTPLELPITASGKPYIPSHLWFGITAENQRRLKERLDGLLRVPSFMRWLSIEPMLERMSLRDAIPALAMADIRWVICGAESGPGRRPFDIAWAEELYRQCHAAGVPFFGKQASGQYPGVPLLVDGRIIHEWPRQEDA